VSEKEDQRGTELEEASSRLTEGLQACHSIVRNYRAMIAGDQRGDQSEPETRTEGS